MRRMRAPPGGESGGITAIGSGSAAAVAGTLAAYACSTSLGLEPCSLGAVSVAGNCVLKAQQSAFTACAANCCMQQLCRPRELCCLHIPSGVTIIPTSRMTIDAR